MKTTVAQKTRIEIYDTTLRDGSQGEGISYSVEDKIRIAKRLDEFGMDYIEGGWPGSNPKDESFFERMKSVKLKHAKLAAFGSTRRANVKCEDDVQVQRREGLGHGVTARVRVAPLGLQTNYRWATRG